MIKTFLCYEDFGAVGDGKKDDFDAIRACHEEANRTKTPVKAKPDAVYYIGGSAKSATIKTSVDFGTSRFIIDDTSLSDRQTDIFIVASDYERYKIDLSSLSKDAEYVDIPHEGENIYVRIFDENRKVFIREGLNMNSGSSASDCFTVDKNRRITPSINWDYKTITSAYAKCTDDAPITISGGIFTTIANREESFYRYHSRGFNINRSHVTVENVTHLVEGEIDHGAPYAGFIRSSEIVDLTVKNCLLTPHFIYKTQSKIPGKLVPMGSYDINFSASIDVKCIGIKQTVDIMDRNYWGIYTSNFCKNLYLEDCEISRFDAHQGVTNVTIKRCKLGHQCLNLIGFGKAVIEDTFAYGAAFASLRPDYGSVWNGTLTIKNCKWKPGNAKLSIIGAQYSGMHDFGYECTLPKEIYIDGLEILDSEYPDSVPRVLPCYDNDFSPDKPYPYGTPDVIVIKNVKTESGKDCIITDTPELYRNSCLQ